MFITINQIPKELGEKQSFSFCVPAQELEKRQDARGEGVEFVGNVNIDGELICIGEDSIRATGVVRAIWLTPCYRCLQPVRLPVEVFFDERYMVATPEIPAHIVKDEENERYFYRGNKLDLLEMVQDILLINLPAKALCQEDCKGLCSQCGENLNITQCSCHVDGAENNQMAALKALLCDDEEV